MTAIRYSKEADGSAKIGFEACSREAGSPKDELYAAARHIANRAKKPLWLCMSGGLRSELAARAFYEQGIHFHVLTLSSPGENAQDVKRAQYFCRARVIHQEIMPIDISDFFENDVPRYISEGYVSWRSTRYFHMKLLEIIESLGGFAVLGGGDIVLQKDREGNVHINFGHSSVVPLEWCEANSTMHEPYFRLSTPESILATLEDAQVEEILREPQGEEEPRKYFTKMRKLNASDWPSLRMREPASILDRHGRRFASNRGYLTAEFPGIGEAVRLSMEDALNELRAKLREPAEI